jgi:hypothetical protein
MDKLPQQLVHPKCNGISDMDPKTRAEKDIRKLDQMILEFKKLKLDKKYPKVMEWVENYTTDAKHYFEKGDYFTSFGAANYAYGFIDCILVLEGKKGEENAF